MIRYFMDTGPNGLDLGQGPNSTDAGQHIIIIQKSNTGPQGFDVIGLGTYLAIIVGIANICLLIALIYVYLKSYRQLKSKFTMGLLFFASFLLLQNVVSTSFLVLNIILSPGHHSFEIGRQEFPLSSINVIQLIALSILLYITWE